MNIQIFGSSKCFDTKKAMRYFKERNIKFQYVDILVKGLSMGELQSVASAVGLNALFDLKSKDYARLNLDRIVGAAMRQEILLANSGLYRTPIVRDGRRATVGYAQDVWTAWD